MLRAILANTGKLISTLVILFGLVLVGWAFVGQVFAATELERANYKSAIESISSPLAVLVGAIPAIVGVGLIVKRLRKNEPESTPEEPPEPPEIGFKY